jgi:hypothetical protein
MSSEPTITRVELRSVDITRTENERLRFARPLPVDDVWYTDELTTWEQLKMWYRLIPALFTLSKGIAMRDIKTTISGVIKAGFMLATLFGISTGNLTEAVITGVVYGIVEIYQAFQMPDKSKPKD